eukprot:NODE_342_length_9153_cov_0.637376.p2 type:complete len:475 gc:universal NODE_342_length_9153_cov_0.637376:4607-6031(+)
MNSLLEYIQSNQQESLNLLKTAVEIPSISGSLQHRPQVHEMGKWLESHMKTLGISTELRYPGKQEMEGKQVDLPPIILGKLGNDPNKKTLLVYGHYDVQPAELEDGWATDPFKYTPHELNHETLNGKMIARGVSDDKGPVLGWLVAINAHIKCNVELPINFLFCFEGMEESGSEGLHELIIAESQKYFKSADYVCISDNYWLGKTKPCLTYGLRGVSYYELQISGPAADLHSGVFGGTIHEPMTDLIHLMSKLVTPQGQILIPNLLDAVKPISQEEIKLYDSIDFNLNDFIDSIGNDVTLTRDKTNLLMSKWRNPSLSLHGIQGAFHGVGAKTVIPAKVLGKFSIRSVPHQEPKQIDQLVTNYLQTEFQKLNSKNKMQLKCHHGGKSWLANIDNPNFQAGKRAVEKVFQITPDYTREGGSIPVTLTFQDALNKDVLLLPMGACDDGAHSINEKLDLRNYIKGIQLMIAYIHELK